MSPDACNTAQPYITLLRECPAPYVLLLVFVMVFAPLFIH